MLSQKAPAKCGFQRTSRAFRVVPPNTTSTPESQVHCYTHFFTGHLILPLRDKRPPRPQEWTKFGETLPAPLPPRRPRPPVPPPHAQPAPRSPSRSPLPLAGNFLPAAAPAPNGGRRGPERDPRGPHPRRDRHRLSDSPEFPEREAGLAEVGNKPVRTPCTEPLPPRLPPLPSTPRQAAGEQLLRWRLPSPGPGRAGARRAGLRGKGARGRYLMSPLGCRAGQSPHRPLHARPALRHKSSSSFLPRRQRLLPSSRRGGSPGRWASAALAASPARRGGKEECGEGGEEAEQGAGNELCPPSLSLSFPSRRAGTRRPGKSPASRAAGSLLTGPPTARRGAPWQQAPGAAPPPPPAGHLILPLRDKRPPRPQEWTKFGETLPAPLPPRRPRPPVPPPHAQPAPRSPSRSPLPLAGNFLPAAAPAPNGGRRGPERDPRGPHPRRDRHRLSDSPEFPEREAGLAEVGNKPVRTPCTEPLPPRLPPLPSTPRQAAGEQLLRWRLPSPGPGRAGARRAGLRGKGARGRYLMSPLGCRAGQSPHRPLHARPALRHKSSSSFLPRRQRLLPSSRRGGSPGRWASAALAASPARRGGKEECGEGGEEAEQGAGNELCPPSLSLSFPSRRAGTRRPGKSPASRAAGSLLTGPPTARRGAPWQQAPGAAPPPPPAVAPRL
ncbi:PREDICTED: basic proline-rich protein-like [Calidris pugnax]|uniref:basic proline-rich protein-like n=1 Tax=Calidris pugnax TaxID=198806 RepID=UPI00071D01BE|nr:PREDICTED: basic proline-rich protein-like [Calidris pugnax]